MASERIVISLTGEPTSPPTAEPQVNKVSEELKETIRKNLEAETKEPPAPMSLDEQYYHKAVEYFNDNLDARQAYATREWEHIQFSIKKFVDKYHGNLTERDAARIMIGLLNRFFLKSGDELLKACAQKVMFTILIEDMTTHLHKTNGILPSSPPPASSEGNNSKIEVVRR